MNKEIIEKIKSSKSASDLKNLANKNGYNLTDEEANNYFNMYHSKGHIDDSELNNVSGGLCYSTSGDYKGCLIVTPLNTCKFWKKDGGLEYYQQGACMHCFYSEQVNLTLYCTLRTKDNDPCKK